VSTEPGQTLSHYRLIEKIGEGGMGVVWKAEDTVLDRTVAIKVLPADTSRDEQRREMFLREAKLASSVSDAHIVQVYEFGHEGDLDFIVMEYVEGTALNKMLHGRPLPPHKVADFGHQIARALSRAHRKQLLHRDLKPANILVTPDGEAKVVDFGLATLFEPSSLSQTLTRTTEEAPQDRKLSGTLAYMSPEQARMEQLDGRSDVFSLGAILYEMTTGQLPFTGRTPADVLQAVQQARPTPVHDLVPQVPLELDRIIGKAMAPRQRDRYQSMEDLAVDLNRLERELESGSSPSYEDLAKTAVPKRRQQRLLVGIAGVLALVVIALGVWWFNFRPSARLDERTILILPMVVRGQEQGADYVGQAFAEAIAINLAQNRELKISPIPEGPHLSRDEASTLARRIGAARLLTGTLSRAGTDVAASLQLLDLSNNRIVWGTQELINEGGLPTLAHSLARTVSARLGVSALRLYEYPWDLQGSVEMSLSPELAKAVGNLRRNDARAAVDPSERLLAQFPGEPDAHAISALTRYLLWQDGPTAENRGAVERSVAALDSVDPGNPYGEMFRAMLLREHENKPQEAISLYDQILARQDLSASFRSWVLRNRADALSIVGDYDQAKSDVEEALRLNPLHPTNHRILFGILVNMGRLDEATLRIEQAIVLQPRAQRVQYALGWIRYRMGDLQASVAILQEACALHQFQMGCALYAAALQRVGREDEALAAADSASRLSDTGGGNIELARFWVLRGESDRALRHLARALEIGLALQNLSIDVILLEDRDFAPLRGDPRFEEIAQQLKRQIGQE
jgi:tetratricopeptide (TPR) repeat protein/tRNA A-37 threonylcarbamoyl transferase component Bud32